MLWMMMISLSFAAPCEWIMQPQNVEAKRRTITIDGEKYKAKEVAKQLRECDQDEAAEAVELWQSKRKAGVATMIGSAFVSPCLLFGRFYVALPILVFSGGVALVSSGRDDRERAIVLIKEGRKPVEETPPAEANPTYETLDPSTFDAPDAE